MPTPSEIIIYHRSAESAAFGLGQDITDHVLFQTARFEAQSGGGIGTFSFTIRDRDRDLSFMDDEQINTGDQILLYLDGVRVFGGYIQQVGRTFAFPVVNTVDIEDVTARYFTIRGSNFNILFDRLVGNRPADYLKAFPVEAGTTMAGTLVTKLANDYIDLPAGFNTSLYVDDVARIHPYDADWNFVNAGEQGKTFREEMEWVRLYNAAIYYFDANKNLHFHAPEKVFAPWGFSDRPNKRSVLTTDTTFTGATYGFRELNTTQDLTAIVNDVFVWGGSPYIAEADEAEAGGTVFARRQNTVSQAEYGRWQMSETAFGVLGMGSQGGVDARAEMIVPPNDADVPPGIGGDGVIRNRSRPSWTTSLTWFGHDVPVMNNGVPRYLVPGEIVTIVLYVHGNGLANPLILTLPMRRMTISFPTLPSTTGGDPETYVRFDGDFGLALDDPHQLWSAIEGREDNISNLVRVSGSPATTGSPGAIWQGAPDEVPNGTRTTFSLSSGGNPIAYAAVSSEVTVGGLVQRQGHDYSENPSNGTISIFVPPPTGAIIWVRVRLAG